MIDLAPDTFRKEVMDREGEYLLLFYATWAPPSVFLLEELQGHNQYEVLTVDVGQMPDATSLMGVQAAPTLFFMRDGRPVKYKIGYVELQTVSELLS